MRQFLRVRPGATLIVIAATGLSGITKLLAFFLPLKVLLLAGSDGVPRYFPFIDPTQKTGWIIGLTIGAFACYALTLVLESVSKRLSENAGAEILSDANILRASGNDEKDISKSFAQFCESVAALIVVGIACLVLALINQPLLGFLLTSVAFLYALSAWVVRGEELPFSKTKNWMIDQARAYLSVASTLIFFGGFLVILAPFLMGHGGNVLLALLSLILMRQMIGNLSDITNKALKLTRDRYKIDTLIFRNVSLPGRPQTSKNTSLRAWFNTQKRQELSSVSIVQSLPNHRLVSVHWQDSALHGIKTLALTLETPDGSRRTLMQKIVPPANRDQTMNEDHLRRQMPKAALGLPALIEQFEVEDYQCQILDYPAQQGIAAKQWRAVQKTLLIRTWGIKPSKTLVTHYRQIHPLLADRLTDDLCRELEMGVDTDAETHVLKVFTEKLPLLRSQISTQPLVLYNPDLTAANVASVEEELLIMHWGRWRIEPLGTALSLVGQTANAQDYLQSLAAMREDTGGRSWEGDLQLGALAWQWKQQIKRENYKAALSTASLILKSLQTDQTKLARTA